MPKPALSDAGRSKGNRRASDRTRPTSRKRAKKKSPAIMRSQSVHHGTPPIVLDGVVYPVFGCPVDLDPCSNATSIVQAKRHIVFPAEDGLEIPWYGTVYCNPPYGMPEIERWLRKCVIENRRNGAEIIALLPAHTSSSWFDYVAASADACFFWGPGVGGRRLKHVGNDESAAFHSCLVYWGPRMALFSSYAGRYAHAWYPSHDLRLLRALIGDTRVPEGPSISIAKADDLLTLSRNDDLVEALAALGNATLGDILDVGTSILRSRLRKLTAYELGVALLCASRASGRSWLDHRIPSTPTVPDPRQLGLLPSGVSDATSTVARVPELALPPTLEEAVLEEVGRASALGTDVSMRELEERFSSSIPDLRKCLTRLSRQRKIIKQPGRDARYTANQEKDNAARQ